MKEIPSSKVERAAKFVKTGIKVGGNYLKHYAQKVVNPELEREALDQANASDIYEALSELKGSALKAAQMLSMDQGLLPAAFSEKFSEAQYKAPPLSGPLVVKTFQRFFGKQPLEMYDTFEMKAVNAASIGQVHQATKEGKLLAVKIQYPGVAESVVSDLNIIRPVARRLFGWKEEDIEVYFEEVKARLVEETDYELERTRGTKIAAACKEAGVPNLRFPNYYPALSSARIITMDWMEGMHLDAFLATNPSQEIRNKVGQAIWDFYNFQIHTLCLMHADAHPGNFLFNEEGVVGVLDFGCIKEFPRAFYETYFEMLKPGVLEDDALFRDLCIKLEALTGNEHPEQEAHYLALFKGGIELLCKPFHSEVFDFGDVAYFDSLYAYGAKTAQDKVVRNSQPRGSQHGIYLNRSYFGIFSLLHALGARIETRHYMPMFA